MHSAGRTPSRCGTRTALWRAACTGSSSAALFAAESKFHVRTDASKVAVVALAARLREAGGERLIDVQWTTPHLAALGVRDMPRRGYMAALRRALVLPPAF